MDDMNYISTCTAPRMYLKDICGVCYLTWVTNPKVAQKLPKKLAHDLLPILQSMEPWMPMSLVRCRDLER
jgi:hypothetical protein